MNLNFTIKMSHARMIFGIFFAVIRIKGRQIESFRGIFAWPDYWGVQIGRRAFCIVTKHRILTLLNGKPFVTWLNVPSQPLEDTYA